MGLPDAEALGGGGGDGFCLSKFRGFACFFFVVFVFIVVVVLLLLFDLHRRDGRRQPPRSESQGARRGVDARAARARGDGRDGLRVLEELGSGLWRLRSSKRR